MEDCKNKAATAATREKPEGTRVYVHPNVLQAILSTVGAHVSALVVIAIHSILMN
jgi:hypothetical protein